MADLYPQGCGNGIVNTDDLLVVINNWGSCSSFSGNDPLSLEDVVVMLTELYVEHPEWTDAITEALTYILENGLD